MSDVGGETATRASSAAITDVPTQNAVLPTRQTTPADASPTVVDPLSPLLGAQPAQEPIVPVVGVSSASEPLSGASLIDDSALHVLASLATAGTQGADAVLDVSSSASKSAGNSVSRLPASASTSSDPSNVLQVSSTEPAIIRTSAEPLRATDETPEPHGLGLSPAADVPTKPQCVLV